MKFTKMQGLGNDYVYFDCMAEVPDDLPGLAREISDRHFGVGADGLICILPSARADFQMRMFNADGSEGTMCGNGIRCVGKFIYDNGLSHKTHLQIETLSGVKALLLHTRQGAVTSVTVDMGIPIAQPPRTLTVAGLDYRVTPVDMGNPHAVLFLAEIDTLDLPAIGPGFEHHPSFPHRTNTEFVEVLDRTHLKMRVWERGSGETLACGTGASAALVAAVLGGLCDPEATVTLRGGDLKIAWGADGGHLYMTGPAVTVFCGDYPT